GGNGIHMTGSNTAGVVSRATFRSCSFSDIAACGLDLVWVEDAVDMIIEDVDVQRCGADGVHAVLPPKSTLTLDRSRVRNAGRDGIAVAAAGAGRASNSWITITASQCSVESVVGNG